MDGTLRIIAEIKGAEAALAVAAAFDEAAGAVSAFETDAGAGLWRVEAYPRTPVLDAALEVRLRLAAAAAGGKLLRIAEERLPERDWLAENRRAFPPLVIGRFFIHGSHWKGSAPAGAIAIEIDAATAFGTGEHASTRGCLRALDGLARRRRFAPAARHRHRQRHFGDRRGKAVAAKGVGERCRLRGGAGRDPSRQAQRARRPGARRLRRGLPQPGFARRAIRSDLCEYSCPAAGADGARSGAGYRAGRGCRSGGIAAAAGSVGGGGAPGSGSGPGAPPRH